MTNLAETLKIGGTNAKPTIGGKAVEGVNNFADALAYVNKAIQDAAEAAASAGKDGSPRGAINGEVNYRGQMLVRFGDSQVGAFPVLSVTANQMNMLIAHWPAIVKYFESNKAQIADSYQSLPPARPKGEKAPPAKVKAASLVG